METALLFQTLLSHCTLRLHV